MMAPTTEDLRSVLRGMADDQPAPAPRDLLADLRAERSRRRRHRAALAGAAAVAAVVVGVSGMQLLGGDEAPPPADGTGSTTDVTPVPLPPGEDVSLEATWTGDVPARGEAVLGVYREASWAEYDSPGWPDPPLNPPGHGEDAVVLDPTSAAGPAPGGTARSATVTLTSDSELELWRGIPGGLEVEVDGVRITADGDAWQDADAELRDGVWTAFAPGQRRTLALPGDVLPGPGETRTVTVTVVPRAGDSHWQVAVLATAGVPAALEPVDRTDLPAFAADLPEWHAGHRLAAAWTVPSTGVGTRLALPDDLTEGNPTTWVLVCPSPGSTGMVATARVVVDGAEVERTCVPDPAVALTALLEPTAFASLPDLGPGSSVQVAVLAVEGEEAVVATYVPVPYEDFDLAAARAPLAGDPMAAVRGEVVVDRVLDPSGLSDGAVQDVPLDEGTVGVQVTTEGAGRLRLLVDGAPAEGWGVDQEGWWTSWTEDRARSCPWPGCRDSTGPRSCGSRSRATPPAASRSRC
ncbi:hypothetical protein FB476_0978 [Ornithinimicrobium humiphilum]|uniref:Uncharacterized protein n=2 Tax=Ornithinimicrobium humiphilum TaxID=125288 RepID=A0A543KM25_9MICO|nr:hypothetical protein FB476_0978 [Ornithinimicrobium humiphilum]